jgi:uncharacterized SAM-binding protein YcdF (DUF218 family)
VGAGTGPAVGPPLAGTRDARSRSPWRWLVLALLLATAVLVSAWWFATNWLWPDPVEPFGAGPVVVLGGAGERVPVGVALAEGGQRELVLSSSAAILYEQRGGDCDRDPVRCVEPIPETTFGEAQLVRSLAQAEGWPHVTVVTAAVHVPRSRMLFERCVDVPVAVVAAPTTRDARYVARAIREAAGTLVQAVRHRCP